jgi:uncharacterized membrane protein HdeD (DUF308 family)
METIRANKGLFIFESLVFILLGLIAIAVPGLFTLSIELLVGILFVVAGVIQLCRSFQGRKASEIATAVISGLFYVAIGVLLLVFPVVGILSLTMLIAIIFFIQGILQIYRGITLRGLKSRGFWIFSGIISLLLAIIIFAEWPTSAIWFIGLLVGINLLFYGLSLLFITIEA